MIREIKTFIHELLQTFDMEDGFHKEEKVIVDEFYQKLRLTAQADKKTIVFMVDGRATHGGLADRLKGLISAYGYAKAFKADFKVHFVYPFNLHDYLIPNTVDWRIDEKDIVYTIPFSKPITVNDHRFNPMFHKLYVRRCVKGVNQLHFYGNSSYYYDDFTPLFSELFKPSERLQQDIDYHLQQIGGHYVSITYRFQQLLGDFKERNYPTLPTDEREHLIMNCLNQIKKLHNLYLGKKVLVTSDSVSFLTEADKLDYVYIIEGNVVHMDWTGGESFKTYEKSFLDFFLLAQADVLHLAYNHQMYHSGFAKLASKVYNRPYKEIKF